MYLHPELDEDGDGSTYWDGIAYWLSQDLAETIFNYNNIWDMTETYFEYL